MGRPDDEHPRRPPGHTPSARFTATCSTCGASGDTAAAVSDLGVLWLLPGEEAGGAGDGGLAARRFCRGCQPAGPLGEVACAGCGDGPLLVGSLAEATDLATAAAIDTWLTTTGWRPAGPWCPTCAAPRRDRRDERAAR